jgi:oligoendopeptidase F
VRNNATMSAEPATEDLPRWSVADLHESLDSRSFSDAHERSAAELDRLIARFDEHEVRSGPQLQADADAGSIADSVIAEFNRVSTDVDVLEVYIYSSVATDSRNTQAQSMMSEFEPIEAKIRPLLARLADWISRFDLDELAQFSVQVDEHRGPLERLSERAQHQMAEGEEHLYAELASTGSGAWGRLQQEMTSQLSADVELPTGAATLPMPAVRGLATNADPVTRRAGYDAELGAWPTIQVPLAAALNAIKGEANAVNRRRNWASPLEASLFANSVSRATFDAMQSAITTALPDFRRWMRAKADLHGHATGSLPWWDLVAPAPVSSGTVTWSDGLDVVRSAFGEFSPTLGGLVDRAIDERWIDAAPRDGKSGGAFCMPFVGDRSLVLLNWSGSAGSTQVTAHELGHAYHNTTLADRTALQRRLPMALAETASIFCETLVVEAGLARLTGDEHRAQRLSLLDLDIQGANQIVVDIRSRFVFETEVFARRQRRTISATELSELMVEAQVEAYGDGLDSTTTHPYMWLLKSHYFSSHFYNWPYTYGLLFGLGLFAKYKEDRDRFRSGYDTLLSRAGMDTAEELGAAFGFDVTDEAFWIASLDVIRSRIADYEVLASQLRLPPSIT